MNQISLKKIFIVFVVIFLLSRSRRIAETLGELQLGKLVSEFFDQIWTMHPQMRYLIVLLVAALLYITVFVLIKNRK